jgi:hypothetical protein
MSRFVLVNNILPRQLVEHGRDSFKQCPSLLLVGGILEFFNESPACFQLIPISQAFRLV